MTIQQLLLAGGCPDPATVSLDNITLSSSDTNGINDDLAGAYITIWFGGVSAGDINYDEYIDVNPGTPAFLQQWLDAGDGYSVEVMLTKSSGTDPQVGTLDTWLDSSYQTWHWWQSGVGSRSFSGTLSIRDACSGTVLDTCTVTVSLNVT